MKSGMLDSAGTDMGTRHARPATGPANGGSARRVERTLIERQLSRQMGVSPEAAPANLPLNRTLEARLPRQTLTAATRLDSIESNPGRKLNPAESFVRKHQAAADAAERATGIPAANILGQAALESGWGKREIRANDGSNSHNLFGIKAGPGWKGKVAEVTTTEYIGGVARKVTAKFRAYDSYEDAFKDHGRLLSQSPRYSQAVAQADSVRAYAQGLQRGGYATDPAYADKLTQVINMTLRLQQRSALDA